VKECSTPPQAQGYYRVSKYPGYPTRGKIRHPARLLKNSIIGDPKSTNNMSAAQGANDELYLVRALRRGLEYDRCLGRHLSASPEPPRCHQKRLTPRGAFPSCLRGTWNPQARQGATRAPNHDTRPHRRDGDVTVHSQQGHGNHALTRQDPSHSTTTTSMPPQQWG
jgi:hypothetical protein